MIRHRLNFALQGRIPMIRNRISSILAVSLLAACASVEDPKPAPTSTAPSATPSSSATPAPVQKPGVAATPTQPGRSATITTPGASRTTLGKNSVYFDYDK